MNSIKNYISKKLGIIIPGNIITYLLSIKPISLEIELTNICNAKCINCAYRVMKREKGIMNFELYKKIIDEFSKLGGGDISLTGIVGDPLIDPLIIEKISYTSHKKNIRQIRFNTNGILLKKRGIKKLLLSGVNRILIDIGGMDKNTYQKLFGVNAFEIVYNNILEIINVKNQLNSPVELDVVIKFLKKENILNSNNYKKIKSTGINVFLDNEYDLWCGKIVENDFIDNMKIIKPSPMNIPCSTLWDSMTIMWDGRVPSCCRDVNGELILGNVKYESLLDVWQGKRMKKIRESFIYNKQPDMCKKCGHYKGLKPIKNLHYFKEGLKNLLMYK